MPEFAEKIVRAVLEETDVPAMTTEREFEATVTRATQEVQAILARKTDKDVGYMDLSEFGELGYLQEANRLFFHPLGLALELTVDNDDSGAGYRNAVITGIWDYRDDPEGMCFGSNGDPGDIAEQREKATNVANERAAHFNARVKLFQPEPEMCTFADIEPLGWVYPTDG